MADLTRRQRRAISLLLSCPTVRAASQLSGIPERTLYRWLKRPDFQAALREAENEALRQTSRMLTAAQQKALLRLFETLDLPVTRTMPLLRAIELALTHSVRFREAVDFEQRLRSLESEVFHENGSIDQT